MTWKLSMNRNDRFAKWQQFLKTIIRDAHDFVRLYSSLYETNFNKIKYFANNMLTVFGTRMFINKLFF